jgi:hypothetical protein
MDDVGRAAPVMTVRRVAVHAGMPAVNRAFAAAQRVRAEAGRVRTEHCRIMPSPSRVVRISHDCADCVQNSI